MPSITAVAETFCPSPPKSTQIKVSSFKSSGQVIKPRKFDATSPTHCRVVQLDTVRCRGIPDAPATVPCRLPALIRFIDSANSRSAIDAPRKLVNNRYIDFWTFLNDIAARTP